MTTRDHRWRDPVTGTELVITYTANVDRGKVQVLSVSYWPSRTPMMDPDVVRRVMGDDVRDAMLEGVRRREGDSDD